MSDVVNTTTAAATGVVQAAAPAPAVAPATVAAPTPVLTVVAAAAPPAPSTTPAAAKPTPAHAAGRVAAETKGGESWLSQHRVKLMVAGFVLAAALGGIIAWVR